MGATATSKEKKKKLFLKRVDDVIVRSSKVAGARNSLAYQGQTRQIAMAVSEATTAVGAGGGGRGGALLRLPEDDDGGGGGGGSADDGRP
ncbi:hypothetical protein OUZ56_007796 [Daphnia magna]|uniref:Uncharacterized protein n=1 Tax=Daphnia magna TaxID=35525 RepID=A0ABR0AB17_9CRUS|nr:hypothetical protein OUZ56_007796 [Daphnia magna]